MLIRSLAKRTDRLVARLVPGPAYLRMRGRVLMSLRRARAFTYRVGGAVSGRKGRGLLRIGDRVAGAILPRAAYLGLRKTAFRLLSGRMRKFRRGTSLQRLSVAAQGTPSVRVFGSPDAVATPIGRFFKCDGSGLEVTEALDEALARAPVRCKLVMCCAFLGRHRLLRHVVSEALASRYGVEIYWMLVGSTPEDLLFIQSLGRTTGRVAGFVAANNPLGAKWQAAVRYAGVYFESDLVGITGSDDIVSHALVDRIIDMREADVSLSRNNRLVRPALYGTQEWLLLVSGDQFREVPQLIRCNYSLEQGFEPLGAGRFYTAEFLKEVDYTIFEGNQNRCLDDRGYFSVRDRQRQVAYYGAEEGCLISVKGNWEQLNKLADILHAPQVTCREFSFEGYGLLEQQLSRPTREHLFRTGRIAFQLPFSAPAVGVVHPSGNAAAPTHQ